VKPVVDSVFTFEDTLKAYERIMSKRAKGKVVVRVDAQAERGNGVEQPKQLGSMGHF
jgi:hypothetical protein